MRSTITSLLAVLIISGAGFAQAIPLMPANSLSIKIVDDDVKLQWEHLPGFDIGEIEYKVVILSSPEKDTLITTENFYLMPLTDGYGIFAVYYESPFYLGLDEIVLEDFESGTITLSSYSSSQDREPNNWQLDTETTYNNSQYSLLVYGNTWKVQQVNPIELLENSMWGIAVNSYDSPSSDPSEICAFGVGAGDDELFYTFRGSQMADSVHWRNTYFCVGPEDEWIFHFLPIGIDWFNAYGYNPTIDRFVYLNDEDSFQSNGGIFFDYICDITDDLPIAPEIWVDFEQLFSFESPGMTFQFTADAIDPDSDTLFYHWEFGQEHSTDEQNPIYTFPWEGYFTVEAQVRDETGLIDRQTIHIEVPLGATTGEITVNFTGDAMMGRRYESQGIIPNLGADAIWESSYEILGGEADLSFINLECVFSTDVSTPHPTKEYIFYGNPQSLLALQNAGIDGVTLANNHVMDYMEIGQIQTEFHLDTLEIEHCGSGANDYLSNLPMVHYKDGISVANLGYCNRTGRADNLPPFMESGPNKAGFTWFTEFYLQESVPQSAELYDIVVVQVHCGTEYDTNPDTSLGGDGMGEEPWMPIPLETDSTTLELQYQAIDMGADLVVAHHPHVLQGYEVYNGKLIAHSMGNYAFDQNIYETFTSMILYTRMDKDAINSCYFRPVFIDDYIPKPATGALGRAIIDRIADYSRRLNTTVLPVYESDLAFIALDQSQISYITEFDTVFAAFPDSVSDTTYSNPVEIYWDGFLSDILQITGVSPGQVEVRYGREMLWFGNFEDEGATMWDLGSAGTSDYDFQIKHEGLQAVKIYANSYMSDESEVKLENRFSLERDDDYTLCGWIKGINSDHPSLDMDFYSNRYSGGYQGTQTINQTLMGTFDWQHISTDLEIPDDTNYGNISLNNSPPIADEGWVWFDDIKLIHWENDWHSVPIEIPHPNNYRFLQFRIIDEYTETATVIYTLAKYDGKNLWFNQ